MNVRLHIGSGTVFLKGYVNVDVPNARTYLAAEHPQLVERYVTVEPEYYARHADHNSLGSFRGGPRDDAYLCDRFGRWDALPCRDGEALEVLGRQTFEHLSEAEAHAALREVWRVLAPSGRLRLSVPDHDETLRQYANTFDPVLIRHLLGPRNGSHGYHLMSYTVAGLRGLVEGHGFRFDGYEDNPHAYPAICCAWIKPELT